MQSYCQVPVTGTRASGRVRVVSGKEHTVQFTFCRNHVGDGCQLGGQTE